MKRREKAFWVLVMCVEVTVLTFAILSNRSRIKALELLQEPYSEEQWLDDVTSEGVFRNCGESLCPACAAPIVCYDGGVCPETGRAHPLTLCSVEHEVK